MIANRKKKYYQKEVEKLKATGSHQIPYKVLRNISDTERPPAWTVEDLANGRTATELAEDLADYFSAISAGLAPLSRGAICPTYDRQVEDIEIKTVAEKLKAMKKPQSSVSIDPLGRFINPHAEKLAEALTPIINYVRRGGSWPNIW